MKYLNATDTVCFQNDRDLIMLDEMLNIAIYKNLRDTKEVLNKQRNYNDFTIIPLLIEFSY